MTLQIAVSEPAKAVSKLEMAESTLDFGFRQSVCLFQASIRPPGRRFAFSKLRSAFSSGEIAFASLKTVISGFETAIPGFETAVPGLDCAVANGEIQVFGVGSASPEREPADPAARTWAAATTFHPSQGRCPMKFPDTEPEILALARQVVEGLRQMEAELPAPPVPLTELQSRLERTDAAIATVVVATTALRQQHAVKDQDLDSLMDGTKANLRYAEIVFRDQPEKLSQLGWGPRRDGSSLEAPGEVRDIRVVSEGDTWITLRWNPPADGGAVGMYKIQRKTKEADVWEDAGSSVDTVQTLSHQPRGTQMDYRVHAVNKAGIGQPSATVTVVL